jgi:transcriptional regulator with XRE-family HTH domain
VSEINERIRFLRRRRGWSLRELADRSDLSASFISQVERSRNSPSVASLEAICRALEVNPVDLFEGTVATAVEFADKEKPSDESLDDGRSALVRPPGQTVKYQFLSASFPGRDLEAIIGEFPPGYSYPVSAHEGEEFGYVLHGALTVILKGKSHELGPGGTYQFKSTDPHGFEANSKEGCILLWVQTHRYTTPYEKPSPA